MDDAELLTAVCCVAGTDGDVTVEELQALRTLAGLKSSPFRALIDRSMSDKRFREEQMDLVATDANAAMRRPMQLAAREASLDDGHITMLLWRVATKLQISAERLESLLAEAKPLG